MGCSDCSQHKPVLYDNFEYLFVHYYVHLGPFFNRYEDSAGHATWTISAMDLTAFRSRYRWW